MSMRLLAVSKESYALYIREDDGKEWFVGVFSHDENCQQFGNGAKVPHEGN